MKKFAIKVVNFITGVFGIAITLFGCAIGMLAQLTSWAADGLVEWGSELAGIERCVEGKYAKKY